MLWLSRHWQAAQRDALPLIHQNPYRESLKDKDIWSFHLEESAVPICFVFYKVL